MNNRPRLPITIYLLPVVIAAGLVALGIAAFTAFSRVAPYWQAIFAAAVIEVSMIVEALALVRGKNWIGLGGMLASLTVSGTYNYIQARTAGEAHGITGAWELGTLALGPLIALAFLSLTLGQEIRKYESVVRQWESGNAARAEEDQRAAQHEREQERTLAARLELEKEKARLAAETELERYRAIEERKAQVSRARIEARKEDRNLPADDRKVTETFRDWRSLPDEDKAIVRTMTTTEIQARYDIPERTARNWKKYAANSNGKAHTPNQG